MSLRTIAQQYRGQQYTPEGCTCRDCISCTLDSLLSCTVWGCGQEGIYSIALHTWRALFNPYMIRIANILVQQNQSKSYLTNYWGCTRCCPRNSWRMGYCCSESREHKRIWWWVNGYMCTCTSDVEAISAHRFLSRGYRDSTDQDGPDTGAFFKALFERVWWPKRNTTRQY